MCFKTRWASIRDYTVVIELILSLCNENLNTFITRLPKLFKGGKYSREQTIRGNMVSTVFWECNFEFKFRKCLYSLCNMSLR